jgi:hypothetical protein
MDHCSVFQLDDGLKMIQPRKTLRTVFAWPKLRRAFDNRLEPAG